MSPIFAVFLLVLSSAPDVDAIVEKLRSEHDVPGVGLALVRGGEVLLATGYGVADARSGAKVTEETVFSLGSASKAFTAATVLQLAESGKLSLEAPIATLVPDFAHPEAKTLTLRQLLSHTSGFPRLPEWDLATRAGIVKRLAETPLESRPGATWRYCNQNFILAGHVVERTAGAPWEDVLRGSIFEPLGMAASHASLERARTEASHAQPHVLDVRAGGPRRIEFESHLGPWGPSGNVHASARDMAAWARFQAGGGGAAAGAVLSPASLAEMHREQVSLASAPAAAERRQAIPVEKMGYGLGWYTEEFRGKRLVSHEGTLGGFTSSVTLVPEARAAVVLLTNGDHAIVFCHAARLRLVEWLLALEPKGDVIADVRARAKFEPARHRARLEAARTFSADPASFAPLLGAYASVPPGGPALVVSRAANGLALAVGKGLSLDLVPFEKDGFIVNSPPMIGNVLRFRGSVEGTVVIVADDKPIGVKTGR